jgi:hypothetical protein
VAGRSLGAEVGATPPGVLASTVCACVAVGTAVAAKTAPFVVKDVAGLLPLPSGVGWCPGRLFRGGASELVRGGPPPLRACCVQVG